MSWLGYVGLSAALVAPAGPPHAAVAPDIVFAPSQCAYAVAFPSQPTISQSTALDGGANVAADLVRAGIRFSAACIAAAPGPPAAPLPPSEAAGRMTEMARALGLQNATIRPLGKLGSNCGEIEGLLGDGAASYRIDARICIAAGSTFIAETILRAGPDDASAQKFLDSIAPK